MCPCHPRPRCLLMMSRLPRRRNVDQLRPLAVRARLAVPSSRTARSPSGDWGRHLQPRRRRSRRPRESSDSNYAKPYRRNAATHVAEVVAAPPRSCSISPWESIKTANSRRPTICRSPMTEPVRPAAGDAAQSGASQREDDTVQHDTEYKHLSDDYRKRTRRAFALPQPRRAPAFRTQWRATIGRELSAQGVGVLLDTPHPSHLRSLSSRIGFHPWLGP